MKYIILPPLKLIGAILLTLCGLFCTILLIVVSLIWDLSWPTKEDFEFTLKNTDIIVSPYYKKNPNYFGEIFYKTFFHYAWNIKNKNYVY